LNLLPLQTGVPALIHILRDKIRAQGAVSFAWFMEQALYHPRYGYYSSDRCAIGRKGDYFTNVSVGPVFGRLLAAQFAEIWENLGGLDRFVIVEQGAHHGEFARDVLESVRQAAPEFFSALRYRIVEPFPLLRDRQADILRDFQGKVDWSETLNALEPFAGVYFCNELFDAMPVHLIVGNAKKRSAWMEKFVALDGDRFIFIERPIIHPKLADHVRNLPAPPPDYESEVNLAALELVTGLSRRLIKGYVLAVDYGFSRADFYDGHRTSGTLQCRAQHRLLDSPLEQVGESDITTHVEWTSLAERAETAGLRLAGFTDQHHFLTGILSVSPGIAEESSAKTRRALQTLLHPEMLGRSFQVLALARDMEAVPALSGFRFARNARLALGLTREEEKEA
jgi:SAM-dependent MidA family methyltransferase